MCFFKQTTADELLISDWSSDVCSSDLFRLLDLASAEELAPAGVYNRALGEAGRETDLYRFDAAAGMRFGFDVQSNGSGSNRWRLIDPLGQVVFGPSTLADTGLLTATMAGTYTLLVEGRNSQTADTGYSFLFDVPEIGRASCRERVCQYV